jgi:hypothetical protein
MKILHLNLPFHIMMVGRGKNRDSYYERNELVNLENEGGMNFS